VLLQPRWLVRHLVLIAALTGCFFGARWQLGRALQTHSFLNWSYTVEWCLFAGFALLCWGWYLRDDLRGSDAQPAEQPPVVYHPVAQPVTDDEDPELAAYNRYLASLEAGLNRQDSA
jgi:hypothetical protein